MINPYDLIMIGECNDISPVMWMSSESKTDKQRCHSMLQLPEIRFAGFLDYVGNLIAGSQFDDIF